MPGIEEDLEDGYEMETERIVDLNDMTPEDELFFNSGDEIKTSNPRIKNTKDNTEQKKSTIFKDEYERLLREEEDRKRRLQEGFEAMDKGEQPVPPKVEDLSHEIVGQDEINNIDESIKNESLSIQENRPSLWQRIKNFFTKTIPNFFRGGNKNSIAGVNNGVQAFSDATNITKEQQRQLMEEKSKEIRTEINTREQNNKGPTLQ